MNSGDNCLDIYRRQQGIEKLVGALEAAGFVRVDQQGPGTDSQLRQKGLNLIQLTLPLEELEAALDGLIARLEILEKTSGACGNDEKKFYEYAGYWHDLRKQAVVLIDHSFAPSEELLERLGKRVDFLSSAPLPERSKSLVAQIRENLNSLRFLRACLPNYQ